MANWRDVLGEIQKAGSVSPIDVIRRRYLKKLANETGRNVIAYYSGWLSDGRPIPAFAINDEDKNAFMATIHKMDRTKGLDLFLHTPGGDVAATESIVDYLRRMFGTDIRAVVPQLAMSGGTMIACACRSILMGKQSNLGPVDPQFNGIPANGVLKEFRQAIEEIRKDPACLPMWQTIIGKYHPSFLGSCQGAITWSEQVVKQWLLSGMLADEADAVQTADAIYRGLSEPETTYNHARHIHLDALLDLGLKIEQLEAPGNEKLQDLVLTVHHAYMHTFAMTGTIKIVENQMGVAFIRTRAS